MTDLSDKAVSIKGNQYVLVKDRISAFIEDHKTGSIRTELVSYANGQAVVKAIVVPDVSAPERYFTGYSQAKESDGYINKSAALENCETSAVGRALAMMGIGVIDSVASADEMHKAGVTAPALTEMKNAVVSQTSVKPTVAVEPAEESPEERVMGETMAEVLEPKVCELHHKEMKQRENRKTGAIFYDHRSKNPAGEWIRCEGEGWQPSTF